MLFEANLAERMKLAAIRALPNQRRLERPGQNAHHHLNFQKRLRALAL
jgi:hypothetical protein